MRSLLALVVFLLATNARATPSPLPDFQKWGKLSPEKQLEVIHALRLFVDQQSQVLKSNRIQVALPFSDVFFSSAFAQNDAIGKLCFFAGWESKIGTRSTGALTCGLPSGKGAGCPANQIKCNFLLFGHDACVPHAGATAACKAESDKIENVDKLIADKLKDPANSQLRNDFDQLVASINEFCIGNPPGYESLASATRLRDDQKVTCEDLMRRIESITQTKNLSANGHNLIQQCNLTFNEEKYVILRDADLKETGGIVIAKPKAGSGISKNLFEKRMVLNRDSKNKPIAAIETCLGEVHFEADENFNCVPQLTKVIPPDCGPMNPNLKPKPRFPEITSMGQSIYEVTCEDFTFPVKLTQKFKDSKPIYCEIQVITEKYSRPANAPDRRIPAARGSH